MRPKFMLLQKSAAVEDEDGALTPAGMAVAERYARRWVADGVRDLEVERKYPTLAGLFYDIRSDPDLAREHASEEKSLSKGMDEQVVMVRPEIQTLTVGKLIKAQPYYEGPRGGKWADPQLTIPWKEGGEAKPEAAKEEPAKKPKAPIQIEHKHIPLGKKQEHKGPRTWVDHFEGLPEQTVHAYSMPSAPGQPRQYIPERAQMHEAIIADSFRGKHPVPEGQKPVAIMMMGGGASGKSTLVRKQFEEKGLLGNFVQINSDDVKEQLPEYDIATKDPHNTAKDAAAMVHEESSDIAKEMAARAFGNPQAKYNFVFDGTGANARKYGEMVDKLKERGYHVHLMYADVENPDDAWRRSSSRADKTGRWVPEEMLRHAHASIPQNFEELASKVDSYGMYQLPKDGSHQQIMSGQAGRHEVHDSEYLSKFRARAAKLKAEEPSLSAPWGKEKKAPTAPEVPPGGGTVPSKSVAKSMPARYTDSEMSKAFPQPPQQKPQERFVMNRPPAGAPAQPGAPMAAPQPGAPQAAPKPPMPPGQPPMAKPPTPPQAAAGQPQAAPPGPPQGQMPPAVPPPASEAPASPGNGQISPDFNINDFHQAVLSAKVEPVEETKEPKKSEKSEKTKGTESAPDATPYPEDDFQWMVDALNDTAKNYQTQGQSASGQPATPGQPAPGQPATRQIAPSPQSGQPVQTPQKPLT